MICPSCKSPVHQVLDRIHRCEKGHVWDWHGNIQTREYGWMPSLTLEIDRLRAELADVQQEAASLRREVASDNLGYLAEAQRLRAELAAAQAELPRPAAIVVHTHASGEKAGFHLHTFDADEDAMQFSLDLIKRGVMPHDLRRIIVSTHYPARPAEPGHE